MDLKDITPPPWQTMATFEADKPVPGYEIRTVKGGRFVARVEKPQDALLICRLVAEWYNDGQKELKGKDDELDTNPGA